MNYRSRYEEFLERSMRTTSCMSDRILVYHEGRINGEILRNDILSGAATQATILAKEFGQ